MRGSVRGRIGWLVGVLEPGQRVLFETTDDGRWTMNSTVTTTVNVSRAKHFPFLPYFLEGIDWPHLSKGSGPFGVVLHFSESKPTTIDIL